MIDNVTIKNFAIINEMIIDFHPGLTVITGETGSGKSIILQAINTLVQGNSRKSILKSGATQAVIDLDFNNNSFRKIISKNGRSRSYVNETPKSLSDFNLEFYNKIEFHGQNDQQLILKSENHIDYLDYFCGNQKDVAEIKKIYADIENAKKKLIIIMKKFILMFAALCLITFSANAQTKKGTVLLGAGSQFSETAWQDWQITPKIGYFVQDGLAIGAGYGEADNQIEHDDEHMTVFANYSMGPVTFGYQMSSISKGGAGAMNIEANAWGLAFNVNENLSVSYTESVETYDAQSDLKSGEVADVDQEVDAIQIAYSMGGMSVKAYQMDVTNPSFDENADDSKVTEIALGLAF